MEIKLSLVSKNSTIDSSPYYYTYRLKNAYSQVKEGQESGLESIKSVKSTELLKPIPLTESLAVNGLKAKRRFYYFSCLFKNHKQFD